MIFFYFIIFLILFYVSYIFNKKIGNYDEPSKIKNHKIKTVNSGGLFPFLCLGVISIILFYREFGFISYRSPSLPFFLVLPASIIFLTILSFFDDRKSLSIEIRLFCQLTIVFFSISALPVNNVTNFQNPIFNGLINTKIDIFFTIFIWVYFINITNFYDGHDGLLSFQLINFGTSYYFIFQKLNQSLTSEVSMIMGIIGITFIFFNFSKKYKMFMGDAGSIVSGYLFGYLTIKCITQGYYIAPILISFTLFLDISISLLLRVINKKSIFIRHHDFIFKMIIKKYSLRTFLFLVVLIQSVLSFTAISLIK